MTLDGIPRSLWHQESLEDGFQSCKENVDLAVRIWHGMSPLTPTTEGSTAFMFTSTTALESHSMAALVVLTLTK